MKESIEYHEIEVDYYFNYILSIITFAFDNFKYGCHKYIFICFTWLVLSNIIA